MSRLELPNLFLTKEALYHLSYNSACNMMILQQSGLSVKPYPAASNFKHHHYSENQISVIAGEGGFAFPGVYCILLSELCLEVFNCRFKELQIKLTWNVFVKASSNSL